MSAPISFDDVISQHFSFPSPMMKHMLNESNYKCFKKFYKTCKYFYVKFGYIFIEHISIRKIFPRKGDITLDKVHCLKSNLWLTDCFDVNLGVHETADLSSIFPKIIKCDIWKLHIIAKINLSLNEFKILTKSGTVKELKMYMSVLDSDGANVPLEDVLPLIPNACKLSLGYCSVNGNTMNKLCSLKRQTKFVKFRLYTVNEWLEPNLVNEFFKDNLENKAVVFIRFEDENLTNTFLPEIRKRIYEWDPEKRPYAFPKYFFKKQFYQFS